MGGGGRGERGGRLGDRGPRTHPRPQRERCVGQDSSTPIHTTRMNTPQAPSLINTYPPPLLARRPQMSMIHSIRPRDRSARGRSAKGGTGTQHENSALSLDCGSGVTLTVVVVPKSSTSFISNRFKILPQQKLGWKRGWPGWVLRRAPTARAPRPGPPAPSTRRPQAPIRCRGGLTHKQKPDSGAGPEGPNDRNGSGARIPEPGVRAMIPTRIVQNRWIPHPSSIPKPQNIVYVCFFMDL